MGFDRPRIHWVCPLPPAETDIAHYTWRILPELNERANLTLWTDFEKWDSELDKFCDVRKLDDWNDHKSFFSVEKQETNPGAVFIHIGNSWVYHSKLLKFARSVQSVVVLHDLNIQEMLFDSIHNGLLDEKLYRKVMKSWYGSDIDSSINDVFSGKLSPGQFGENYSGIEVAIENAASVLVHTVSAFDAVEDRKHIPAYRLNLPFRSNVDFTELRNDSGPLQLFQFGYIGPNRRLLQVLDALATIKDEVDFFFNIAGKVWDQGLVSARCKELGISEKVKCHGYLPEATLDDMLRNAHLVFNLRHPTMGEASGSQLRIWNAAAASVVTNQGWYRDLPSDTVFHVSLSNEQAEIRNILIQLNKMRQIGRAKGVSGRQQLLEYHSPDCYVNGVLEIARYFEQDARDALVARSAQRFLADTPEKNRVLMRKSLATLF